MTFWKEVRKNYNDLCELCADVDQALSHIVLISFAVNVFFILEQLYFSLRYANSLLQQDFIATLTFRSMIFKPLHPPLTPNFLLLAANFYASKHF